MNSDTLAHRLLELRQHHWDTAITQLALGRLLGVKAPTISSWERPDTPAVPPQERLDAYAALFATRRTLEVQRILAEDELTDDEQAQRRHLVEELTGLRLRALERGPGTEDPWHFPDGAPVRIICGKLPDPPETSKGNRFNYMAYSAYADLDAMVELFGHVRARNPDSDVRVTLAGRLEDDDLGAHLVVLGNLAMSQTDMRGLLLPRFPLHQVPDDSVENGEVFELVASGQRFRPTYIGASPHQRVIEDVGFLARTRNPLNGARTATVLSGTYTRGVYGAVRTLTDRDVADVNATYLRRRFGDSSTFGILMRVPGIDHAIGTPHLGDPTVRLHEFAVS